MKKAIKKLGNARRSAGKRLTRIAVAAISAFDRGVVFLGVETYEVAEGPGPELTALPNRDRCAR